ncbi:SDR family oxidoreductase [Bradyrhizobium valentinum]|uniref:Nucleoside-diphosphate sugar epimerase n=1 Tax=Bradyrhizobium valentinum TaxID=1518501 RepID=A0A0R3LKK5_9BRAD|nr:SDR family oxidoreductase [Bradyrhizobium valentinum]KRR08011.1 nucleoside-diphosphate sugar epimerase [Bradyrhizobium valentinum]KRR13305.1 nucleoside-diphosphate sugar epimerase [Bradyrhizobium valentinum]
MRILIIGGTGLIGSAIHARLFAEGHDCVLVSRHPTGTPGVHHVALDIAQATDASRWKPVLEGVDAVINAAGALQGQDMQGVHVAGSAALYAACESEGVRRVILFSAIGTDREARSDFSRTRQEGEAALMSRDLDWVVLRPSVVVGRAAYGGSALLRGLASLPVLPVMPDTAPIQPVYLDDVVETVVFFLKPGAPSRVTLDLAGPRQMVFSDAVAVFRRWLRWRPAYRLRLPVWAASMSYRAGDLAQMLGWSTPVNSTAQAEMRRGATGDPEPWRQATGIAPRDLQAAVASEPASVQERWFARLYALKPLIFGVFGLFWIVTGIISLGPGWEIGMSLLREGGLQENFAALTVIAGALADIVIGVAILWRPASRYGLWAALIISLVYVVIGTALVPRLWADPLGPMLKIWPVLILNLVAMAIREDR